MVSGARKGLVALSRLEAPYRQRKDPAANQMKELTTVERDLWQRECRARSRQTLRREVSTSITAPVERVFWRCSLRANAPVRGANGSER